MMKQSSPLYIVGLGGHARVVAAMAMAAGQTVAGFMDGIMRPPSELRGEILGVPILGHVSVLKDIPHPRVAVAIGNNEARARTFEQVREICPTASFPTIVHPQAFIERGANIGEGCHICAGAVICVLATLRTGVIVNTNASVDHESIVGDFCHIGPGARLAGRVRVGSLTQIGIGASVIEQTQVGSNVMIGANAAVVDNIPDNVLAVGVPARIIKDPSSLGA